MFLLWSISTLGLINSFILEPAFIRKWAKSLEFIKIDETDFLLPPWQKKGRSCKEGSVSEKLLPSLEIRFHTLCKIPKIEKLIQKAIGTSWILGPSPALFLCFHDTRVLMYLYLYNSVSHILFHVIKIYILMEKTLHINLLSMKKESNINVHHLLNESSFWD